MCDVAARGVKFERLVCGGGVCGANGETGVVGVCGVRGEIGERRESALARRCVARGMARVCGAAGAAFLERWRFACVEREVRFERFGAFEGFERSVGGAGVVRLWRGGVVCAE